MKKNILNRLDLFLTLVAPRKNIRLSKEKNRKEKCSKQRKKKNEYSNACIPLFAHKVDRFASSFLFLLLCLSPSQPTFCFFFHHRRTFSSSKHSFFIHRRRFLSHIVVHRLPREKKSRMRVDE